MPAQHGADPTTLLAFAVPILFGYMFGDTGQGLLLAAAGYALRRRIPVLQILVPAGLSAACFGLAFGSVFSVEHVVEPLWLNPLERPLVVLGVPLAAGVVLLSCGLVLRALEAHWSGELRAWLATEAGFIAVYLGILASFFHPAGAFVALGGAGAVALGNAGIQGSAGAALKALGELLERTVQILINTLSFARVGAFALAHAGLSSAVLALAHAAGGDIGFFLVLIAGNAVIVALEGLVVSVQTTRLILFEFFARFFQPRGREFRPLNPPSTALESP
jgi:V/A-type H+-transporting ATPase subunit I